MVDLKMKLKGMKGCEGGKSVMIIAQAVRPAHPTLMVWENESSGGSYEMICFMEVMRMTET